MKTETCARCGRTGWMGAHISKGGPNGYNRAYCHGTLDGTEDDGRPSCYELETWNMRSEPEYDEAAWLATLKRAMEAE